MISCNAQLDLVITINQMKPMGLDSKMKFNIVVFKNQRFSTTPHCGNKVRFTKYINNFIL